MLASVHNPLSCLVTKCFCGWPLTDYGGGKKLWRDIDTKVLSQNPRKDVTFFPRYQRWCRFGTKYWQSRNKTPASDTLAGLLRPQCMLLLGLALVDQTPIERIRSFGGSLLNALMSKPPAPGLNVELQKSVLCSCRFESSSYSELASQLRS
jgi:hypothetical protein